MKYLVFTSTGHPVGLFSKTVAVHKIAGNPDLNMIKSSNPSVDMKMLRATAKLKLGSIKSITINYVDENGADQVKTIEPGDLHLINKSGNPYKTSHLSKEHKSELKKLFAKNDKKELVVLFDSLNIYNVCSMCEDRPQQIHDIVDELIKNKSI